MTIFCNKPYAMEYSSPSRKIPTARFGGSAAAVLGEKTYGCTKNTPTAGLFRKASDLMVLLHNDANEMLSILTLGLLSLWEAQQGMESGVQLNVSRAQLVRAG